MSCSLVMPPPATGLEPLSSWLEVSAWEPHRGGGETRGPD